ncbi:MAG: EthD family reductase [Burkholderiaceae bacterium]
MIKVSILYPASEGSRFDHDYYRDSHMPMVKAKLGPACLKYTIDQGVSNVAPGSAPPFHAIGALFFDSVDAFRSSITPHMQEIGADIPKYTSVAPVMLVSEVIVG